MKYVILIHSNPQPWGHPTSDFLAEHQALSQEQRDAENAAFEALLTELSQNGDRRRGPVDPAGESCAKLDDARQEKQ